MFEPIMFAFDLAAPRISDVFVVEEGAGWLELDELALFALALLDEEKLVVGAGKGEGAFVMADELPSAWPPWARCCCCCCCACCW